MTTNTEFAKFNAAMDTILRAEPAKVKAEVNEEIEASRAQRKAKGELKRGRKAKVMPSASDRASSGKD